MESVGPAHLDYWQHFSLVQRGLKNRFGIRVQEGRCWALVQIGDDEARTFGEAQEVPVDLHALPNYLRIVVDEHCSKHPASDLRLILTGKKSFEEAIQLPAKIEPRRAAAIGTHRIGMA